MLNPMHGVAVLGLVFLSSAELTVEVPRVTPTAVVIDGVHEPAEWEPAAVVRLSDG